MGKSIEDVHEMAAQCADEIGERWGIALPSATDRTRPLIMARGIDQPDFHAFAKAMERTEGSPEPGTRHECREKATFIWSENSWRVPAQEISILAEIEYVRDEYGVPLEDPKMKPLRRWIQKRDLFDKRMEWEAESAVVRYGSISLDAELKAQENLFKRLDDKQRRYYVFNGWFMEESKRSGCAYMLRKGKPTLAIGRNNRPLCCLCLHPMGYFSNSYVGVMPPSDEVLAVLLLIRSDEHTLWKKSGQHPVLDPRSGM